MDMLSDQRVMTLMDVLTYIRIFIDHAGYLLLSCHTLIYAQLLDSLLDTARCIRHECPCAHRKNQVVENCCADLTVVGGMCGTVLRRNCCVPCAHSTCGNNNFVMSLAT